MATPRGRAIAQARREARSPGKPRSKAISQARSRFKPRRQ